VSKDRDLGIFGNHGGSESEKYQLNKDLDGVKVLGITVICIVNARDSEPQKLPRLTSAATRQIVVCDVVPRQDSWKGHRGSFNSAENAAVRLL
jgi:hypothetical protein